MEFRQENGRFVDRLPEPETVPVLAKHESLYRAIVRATHPEPARRFSSMDELADQLTAVLHEIAAADGVGGAAAHVGTTSARSAECYGGRPTTRPTGSR